MDIGLIGMSGKPVHAGHWSMIELASTQNDRVIVYVSTSDRSRKGQITIHGDDMKTIWQRYLEPELPDNVEIVYGGSPIRNMWETLGEANESDSKNTFNVYSDPTDLAARFHDEKLRKYVPELFDTGRINRVPLERTSTVDVSGTRMREMLMNDDKKGFMNNLPPVDEKSKSAIWSVLRSRISENALRSFVQLLIT